jgi:hypothetical protein
VHQTTLNTHLLLAFELIKTDAALPYELYLTCALIEEILSPARSSYLRGGYEPPAARCKEYAQTKLDFHSLCCVKNAVKMKPRREHTKARINRVSLRAEYAPFESYHEST